jgi:hypothetical protein
MALNRISDCSQDIFYAATLFMLKHENEASIKLYLYYLNSVMSNHKIVTDKRLHDLIITQGWENAIKTIKKDYPVLSQIYKLNVKIVDTLKNKEQIQSFKDILTKYITNKDIDEALNSVPNIYRKKIRIEKIRIEKIQQQHAESIILLNEYLNDEPEEKDDTVANMNGNIEVFSAEVEGAHPTGIAFSQIQIAVLALFEENNFSTPQYSVENFARSKGALKNQLVESINDMCYEYLDDVLIEENNEYYTVNPDYYKLIRAK